MQAHSLDSFSRHFAFLPAKAARPAAEVARCRGELGLESGLAPALVAAAPQAVTPDQFAVGAFDRVAFDAGIGVVFRHKTNARCGAGADLVR